MSEQQPDEQLIAMAKQAFSQAYAPYSNFRVGAALKTASGKVFFGANVENASYGLTRCAEQSAVQAMASAGEREFVQIVVYSDATPPASPCGACRQILFEFAPEAWVFCINKEGILMIKQVKDYLPDGFRLSD